jgi:gluconokinase
MQIMSDVLGQRIVASAVPEATSRGAALMALEAVGVIPDLGALPAALGYDYEPRAQAVVVYRAARQRQAELYSTLLKHPQNHRRASPTAHAAPEGRKDSQ